MRSRGCRQLVTCFGSLQGAEGGGCSCGRSSCSSDGTVMPDACPTVSATRHYVMFNLLYPMNHVGAKPYPGMR